MTDGSSTPAVDASPGTPRADARPGANGWRAISLPDDQERARVTGIECTSRAACVIATDSRSGSGRVMAASDQNVGATLVDGEDVAEPAGVLGDIGFTGLERTRRGLTARASASGAFVSATGDVTQPSSWTIVEMGRAGGQTLPLNGQESLQISADGGALFINNRGFVYSGNGLPSPTTVWTKLWSPTAVPPIPDGFAQRHASDPTLCDSEVTTGVEPDSTQNVYISPGLELAVHPAGGINQAGTAAPGVCISTDRGVTFFQVPFSALPDSNTQGPIAVTCLDKDRCFAYNGLQFDTNSVYVYRTTNASMGKASTWTRATLPPDFAGASGIEPHFLFFAPDGTHGWLAGSRGNTAMLLRTSDSGQTWTDVTAPVQVVTTQRLHSGFALDADHIWVGGENGTLLFTDRAQD